MKFFKHVFIKYIMGRHSKTKKSFGEFASQKIRTYNTCMNPTNFLIPDFCGAGNQKQIISGNSAFLLGSIPKWAMRKHGTFDPFPAFLRSIFFYGGFSEGVNNEVFQHPRSVTRKRSPTSLTQPMGQWPTLKLFGGDIL